MLREYEKAKMQLMNVDIPDEDQKDNFENTNQTFNITNSMGFKNSKSPFNNFMRTTGGKKIYYYDPKAGSLPPPKFNETTKLSETRQKILYRAENGKPLHRMQKNLNFIPSGVSEARDTLRHKTGGLYLEEYDLKKE